MQSHGYGMTAAISDWFDRRLRTNSISCAYMTEASTMNDKFRVEHEKRPIDFSRESHH